MDHSEATSPVVTPLFSELNLSERMLKTVSGLGYTTPTPIQFEAIPLAMTGKDLIGLAQTGTGKTAAFVIPMIERLLQGDSKAIRALVLAPTRELADQIHQAVRDLTKGTSLNSTVIFGGVSHQRQLDELRRKPSIVVACPGRLLDHIQGRSIDLSSVEMLVVDEADRMCDMGFLPDVRRIARLTPKARQTLLFSATMPDEVEQVTRELLTDPQTVRVAIERPVALITHGVYRVDEKAKGDLLEDWFAKAEESRVVVFTQMKHMAKKVADKLIKSGIKATSLQGNLSQGKRKEAIEGFRKGRYTVLVATDIAARGIDVEGVSHVLNYDMPMNLDSYIHRAGRAGRASRTGEAISFATRRDRGLVRSIERYLGTPMNVLGEMLSDGSGATRTRERVVSGDTSESFELSGEETSAEGRDSNRRPRQSRPRREGGGSFDSRPRRADTRTRGPRRSEGPDSSERETRGEVSSFVENRGDRGDRGDRGRFGRNERGGRSDRGGRFNRREGGGAGERERGGRASRFEDRRGENRAPSFEGLGRERFRDAHASEQQLEGRRRSAEQGSFDSNREKSTFKRFGNESRGGERGSRSRDGAPFRSSRRDSGEGRFATERSPRFDGSDRGTRERSSSGEKQRSSSGERQRGPRGDRRDRSEGRDPGFSERRERSGNGRSFEGRADSGFRGRESRNGGRPGGSQGRFNSRGRSGEGAGSLGNRRRSRSDRETQPGAE